MLYFADVKWWQWHRNRVEYQAFQGQKCTIQNTGSMVTEAAVHMLRRSTRSQGLSATPDALVSGMNSGYQALGLAIAAGATRVVLLGYDMHFPGGKSHWFGDHPDPSDERWYRDGYRQFFNQLARQVTGVEILNATPGSALQCFPMVSLESVLPDPA